MQWGGGGGLVPEHIRQTLNELWTLNGIFAFLYLHRVICFLLTEKGNDNKYDHFIFQQDSATIQIRGYIYIENEF